MFSSLSKMTNNFPQNAKSEKHPEKKPKKWMDEIESMGPAKAIEEFENWVRNAEQIASEPIDNQKRDYGSRLCLTKNELDAAEKTLENIINQISENYNIIEHFLNFQVDNMLKVLRAQIDDLPIPERKNTLRSMVLKSESIKIELSKRMKIVGPGLFFSSNAAQSAFISAPGRSDKFEPKKNFRSLEDEEKAKKLTADYFCPKSQNPPTVRPTAPSVDKKEELSQLSRLFSVFGTITKETEERLENRRKKWEEDKKFVEDVIAKMMLYGQSIKSDISNLENRLAQSLMMKNNLIQLSLEEFKKHIEKLSYSQLSKSESSIQDILLILKEEKQKLKNDENEVKGNLLCMMCMQKKKDVIYLDCGHVCCCSDCDQKLQCTSCPMCRKSIIKRQKVYV